MRLNDAMQEILSGWATDLDPAWAPVIGDVGLDFSAIDPDLTLEPWEPVFPARRGKQFPGAPPGTHMLRAFDGIAPADVRCVILAQDPYPEPGFATGRAFEAGNVAAWRELDKMFSKSVRAFVQLIVAARTGDPGYAASFEDWPRTLAAIENGTVTLEAADRLAQRWVDQGVLLLNSALTLSRFAVDFHPHQVRGHLPLWRPLMQRVLTHLDDLGTPIVFIGLGEFAIDVLSSAGIDASGPPPSRCIQVNHPSTGNALLGGDNPFILCNQYLEAAGAGPISW